MQTWTVLRCEQCETEYGTFLPSEVDITNCGKIENVRGRLVCAFRRTTPLPHKPTDTLPPGSYRNDCTDCKLIEDGEVLECGRCRRADGTTRYTVIETARCKEFTNNDGALACASEEPLADIK